MNKDLLTIEDVCQELGIGRSTAHKLLKKKKIKSCKIGSRLIVRKEELKRYIKEHTS
ncbi:MAG: helix-turn-helix domain-containing protein [Lachnospiraceae bacterium]|jgi:excisionase family DNA binding protein|nr:helix-turn-helix domain-containing protein [Lachnospiraceae bacterium]